MIFVGCFNFGYYSENCFMLCLFYCVNSWCYIEIGYCFECEDGYWGLMCE